jgi:hypothetical protein
VTVTNFGKQGNAKVPVTKNIITSQEDDKMKKNWMWMSVMILTIGLAFVGCATQQVVFSENIQEDQQARIIVPLYYGVTNFSGTVVNWSQASKQMVVVPSGSHTMYVTYYFSGMSSRDEITVNLQAGKTYQLFTVGNSFAVRLTEK